MKFRYFYLIIPVSNEDRDADGDDILSIIELNGFILLKINVFIMDLLIYY